MFSQALINNLLKGSAVLGSTLLPLVVHAGVTNLPTHGGTGGTSFNLDCGNDQVLVGVRGRKGDWLDQLQAVCVRYDSFGWLGGTITNSVGGSGGSSFSAICPPHTAVRGIKGNYGWYVNQLTLRCRPLGTVGTPQIIHASGSVTGPNSFNAEYCPNSKHARGIRGKAGTSVDSVGLICHSGSTPNLTPFPSPSDVVAVNLVNPETGPSTSEVTPYVQVQWTDQSSLETGYQVKIYRLSVSVSGRAVTELPQTNVFNRPAATGSGSRQALTITDLPNGTYIAEVCTVSGSEVLGVDSATRCGRGTRFSISGGSGSGYSTCSPVITSAEKIGAGTGRVSWTHGCNNPSSFSIKLRCGSSPFGTVATAFDGAARQETFPFGVGSGVLQVCAVFPGQSATAFCSAQRSFQCN